MLETAAGKRVDRAVNDTDRASPFGPAIAVGDARTAPPDANLALAVAGFFLQVAVPYHAGVVIRGDFVPALQPEEAVIDFCAALESEFVALHVFATGGESDDALAATDLMGQAAVVLPPELYVVMVVGGMLVGIVGSLVSLGRVQMW